jgi:large conductance mechanosensitive channel
MAKKRDPLKEGLSILEEFKQFILRGNVMDLAVGVIIGGAFNKIVTSLVNDMLMPLLSVITGQSSLSDRFVALDGGAYATMEAAGTVPMLKYGSFIATVLDFLLMGFVIFLLVKFLNFVRVKFTKEKPPAAPAATCPFCISPVHKDATVCPFCASKLAEGRQAAIGTS